MSSGKEDKQNFQVMICKKQAVLRLFGKRHVKIKNGVTVMLNDEMDVSVFIICAVRAVYAVSAVRGVRRIVIIAVAVFACVLGVPLILQGFSFFGLRVASLWVVCPEKSEKTP